MDESLKEKVYVSYGNFLVQSILNTTTKSDDVFTSHWHEAFEILKIYEHELEIDYEGIHFTAQPGDMVIFGANEIHSGRTGANGCHYRALQFKWGELLGSTPFEQKMLRNFLDGTYHFQAKIHDDTANQLFDAVVKAHDDKGIVQPIAEKGRLCELITYLIKKYMNNNYFFSSTDKKLNDVLDYIKAHFTENISTETVAEMFSYNKSHLCRKFKKNTGMSMVDFIHMCRIEYAQQLIKEDKLSLTEIATQCGYNSLSYFSSRFRKMAVISPNEWKSRFVNTNYPMN